MAPVPITREVLAKFYDQHPYEGVSPQVAELTEKAKKLSKSLTNTLPDAPFAAPYRLDDCFWRNRQVCEEVIASLVKVLDNCNSDEVGRVGLEVWDRLKESLEVIQAVQADNTDRIGAEVKKFLPQDFRTKMIEKRSLKKEAKRKQEVVQLIKKGGSVTEKYELLLKHQAERRKALVELGECKGVFRWLIRHLAGVPKVLLDFAKQINAKLGPMEEQRVRFGPHFYNISALGMEIWVLTFIWAKDFGALGEKTPELLVLLEEAVNVYCSELDKLAKFIGNLFQKSPWFVSSDEIKPITADSDGGDASLEDEDGEVSEESLSDAPKTK